ncbi:hypothetical protein L207DRAFT_518501 [Hyaloscypha variabilis F]|uniref:Uncharacterized protein n=1 Tax=Hyaloscypha variabilis (strain UAMH 11265 / GT02V1 / F) TaxID=1149755 RepID=A0A2J6R240_HYAVF|nr:hypothetical protein L207DRAFT_518501 [Hyaloscypha variabilis F]
MPTTKIFLERPTGRKTKVRLEQAAAPPPPPPAQQPLPGKPVWTLPFLWMTTVFSSFSSPETLLSLRKALANQDGFNQMISAAVAFLPEMLRSLSLGSPCRTPSQQAQTHHEGMVRKWEAEQRRRARGGMAWLYDWE